ncbi:serine hydrolase domain-containing protein [Candidatus Protofrankia californiensis]|uniref:serine hydrolase domain-containing protein n=1 Tax=Candidatus Protofrankia californiensis TaxID=1839754 RepID=UPI001040F6BD|nr:serine hydrolase domain-containing protein [Candidatus Protofrankia californiensis]
MSTGPHAEVVAGFVAPGFEPIAEEFDRNFALRGEAGAAFSAYVDGELIVDLWGGVADAEAGRRWRKDTLQLVFSGTKGLVATCLLVLLDRGELCLDAPVCEYWPEFAANGKETISVAELASHRARLPGIRSPLAAADLVDDRRLAALLAEQPPETDQRAARMYHPLTYGWLCGELVRQVSGRSVGRFFAKEIAAPLQLEVWIGLPNAMEPRVSMLSYGPGWGANPAYGPGSAGGDQLQAMVWANPPIFPPDEPLWNRRALHAAEIPGVNGIGTARSMARLYGCLARGGELEGARLASSEAIDLARTELARFREPFVGEPIAYGVGFQLQTEARVFGPPAEAFGHTGAGGSVHAAWPEERVGLSYVMNQMRDDPAGDPRSQALLDVLYEAVRRRS